MDQPTSYLPSHHAMHRKVIEIQDGTSLSLIDVGSGPALIILPGWSQTASAWEEQIAHLSKRYRVLALDHRGHGESSEPGHGYRISRLAADLKEVLEALSLDMVTFLAHSMGCSVVWCYLELYGSSKVSRIILADQSVTLTATNASDPYQRLETGGVFTFEQLGRLIDDLRSRKGDLATRETLRSMVSADLPMRVFEQLVADNMLLPRDRAAALLADHAFHDWSDVVRRIDMPTLVLGGKESVVPWQAMASVGTMIPNSRTVIFDGPGSTHFAFLEIAKAFAAAVDEFLDSYPIHPR
ncbi:alpha/beta hydrolase [Rhizobium sp. 2MFCol3.1]|uniref:alpha/beta fold hydrolase n=1 Tax=Rhizobium sp. 2MFCol3.1 TaxID=1246459 RepID=UPI000374878A|nr:alpha/beta hydrolase [Rhizobium sp. 2MFCol3.1]